MVFFDVGVFSDASWEKAESTEGCSNKRKLADRIIQVGITRDGQWSPPTVDNEGNDASYRQFKASVHSQHTPHMYYFVIMDCTNKLATTFANEGRKQPRVLSEITMMNKIDNELTHFSYEDIGLLRLNLILFLVLATILYQLWTDYRRQVRQTERYLSPHPIMIFSSMAKVMSIGLCAINLWEFSSIGEGY